MINLLLFTIIAFIFYVACYILVFCYISYVKIIMVTSFVINAKLSML